MAKKRIHLSPEQSELLVNLVEAGKMSWKEIAEEISKLGGKFDGEQIRQQYRWRTGSAGSAYSKNKPIPSPSLERSEYEQGDDFIHIICASERMLSLDDIIKKFNIDLSLWDIERFKVKTSESYRKDRKVSHHVLDGKVLNSDVEDSGMMLVVPLYHIEVRLAKKKQEIEAKTAIALMINDAKQFTPQYPKIEYPKNKDGKMYEIAMYDIHFGRLTWDEESGENYDIKLATKAVKSSLLKLLSYIQNESIDRILLPLGNDFFNVDSKFNTTTNGTQQQEDTRWQKTFRKGRELCVWMIDTCAQIAPVDVLIIPGNHDQQRSFYLGDALECWYHNSENVNINNSARGTKYYDYGFNLIGFTHGYDTPMNKMPAIMALDVPELWAKTKYREWHTGDKHHKKDMALTTDESSGVVVRIIRSLVSFDAWTFNSGYRSLRASEAFLWSRSEGLVAQYTALPEME